MSNSGTTPMMSQYLSIKEKYADAILFFRMGDFYEMFFEDAEVASKLLDITLTARNKKDSSPIPMCGFPVRAAQGYIARLIGKGKKVAVCEQVEDPATAQGIVKREVIRLITPGMIVEDNFLDEKSNNYILAVRPDKDLIGISWLDISTGSFRLCESKDVSGIVEEILRVGPSEILAPEFCRDSALLRRIEKADASETPVTFLGDRVFDYAKGRKRLVRQFGTLSLEGFGCEGLKYGVGAAGALLYYVRKTQRREITHITGIETCRLGGYLMIDGLSCRNLELFKNIRSGSKQGTLFSTIDKTSTAMGGRMLKQWMRYPPAKAREIEARLGAVTEAREKHHISGPLRDLMKSVHDIERLGSKISMGYSNARDLVALKRSLQRLPEILDLVAGFEAKLLKWPGKKPKALYALAELIDSAIREDAPLTINEGGIIRDGHNEELDELIRISRDGKGQLAGIESKERAATGINSLKVSYNKVFGYYIEVSKNHSASVPPHYIRKQTLVNAERYITEELKDFETKVLNAQDRRASLEYELFDEVRREVVGNNAMIRSAAEYLATLDCLLGLAEIADLNNYNRPSVTTGREISIKSGRHPVIEKMITGERFVPNTIRMDDVDNQVLVITGPNMAGKSTVLRQVALTVLMAQMGSFVPAEEATIGVCDRIFTRVGALDNLSQGQSTFMVEMQETANILNNATPKSLIIMDEIGRGTSTFDGLSIAWAVAEFLHDLKGRGVKTLFATHYHELTELADTKSRVRNFNIAVREFNDEIVFLRKLVEGGTNRSYGIQVARLAGIPAKVVRRAKSVLAEVEKRTGRDRDLLFTVGLGAEENAEADLLGAPDSELIGELKSLDLSAMTPIEALNCLNELQEKIKVCN